MLVVLDLSGLGCCWLSYSLALVCLLVLIVCLVTIACCGTVVGCLLVWCGLCF